MLFNETKNRKATPNEVAKFIMIDAIRGRMEFLGESFFLDDIKIFKEKETDENGWGKPTKEYKEICRHFEKHYYSLVNRLLNGDNITNR